MKIASSQAMMANYRDFSTWDALALIITYHAVNGDDDILDRIIKNDAIHLDRSSQYKLFDSIFHTIFNVDIDKFMNIIKRNDIQIDISKMPSLVYCINSLSDDKMMKFYDDYSSLEFVDGYINKHPKTKIASMVRERDEKAAADILKTNKKLEEGIHDLSSQLNNLMVIAREKGIV